MDIVIFKELTTNEYLDQLRVDSEKYTGLYVDMNNAPERKYVKEKAEGINKLLKKIDRKRIDASKEYKVKVEKEAAALVEELGIANLPFTLLIDEYKAERAKILAAEKLVIELREASIKKEDDHEMAILINKTFEYDRNQEIIKERELELTRQKEREDYAAERVKQAEKQQAEKLQKEKQDNVNAENARLANKEHVQKVKTDIYFVLVNNGISELDAKKVINLATNNELPRVTVNY